MTQAPLMQAQLQVSGRVQGVGYRFFTLHAARSLGLTGWVRNRANGNVEVLAQGNLTSLIEFQAILKSGPPLSSVDQIVAQTSPATRIFPTFEILPTE